MFIAANTGWPATASSMFELAAYFEMVFLKISPSALKAGFPTYIIHGKFFITRKIFHYN